MIVLNNQSLLDFAITHTGTALSVFEIAVANDISITQELEVGQELIIPKNCPFDRDIQGYYKGYDLKPATAITSSQKQEAYKDEGIDFWGIEVDFIVQ